MARRKRVTAQEWLDANPYPEQKSCDHCGTVMLALQRWTEEETNACSCACHWAKRYDRHNKT